MEHLQDNHPLPSNQWGFQPGKSKTSALLVTIDDWHKLLEDGNEIAAIFIDLCKAFDTVPHAKLIEKLEAIGLENYIIS